MVPALSALIFASCITGPSAVGSENGMPSSIRSAPALAAALTSFFVVSRFGSPQVIKGIKAFPPANAPFIRSFAVLLINILPSVSCDDGAVLVASA